MSKTLGTGTIFAIGSLTSNIVMSAISNANPAVLTIEATSPSPAVGSVIKLQSGWAQLDGQSVRVLSAAGTSVTLEGIDTTDTDAFPPGTGAGTIQLVTSWAQFPQIQAATHSGGEQQFADASTLEDLNDKQVPTSRTADSYQLVMYDDFSLPINAIVKAAQKSGKAVPIRITARDKSKIYFSAFVSIAVFPSITRNVLNLLQIDMTSAADPARYAV